MSDVKFTFIEGIGGGNAIPASKRYFIAFVHKTLPHGFKEFSNAVIELEYKESFDVRSIEKLIQEKSNLQDVTVLSFQLLLNGER